MRPIYVAALLSATMLIPATALHAKPVDRSLRPMVRPFVQTATHRPTDVRNHEAQVIAALAVRALQPDSQSGGTPTTTPVATPARQSAAISASLRPRVRPAQARITGIVPTAAVMTQEAEDTPAGFRRWIVSFRNRAVAQGIDGSVFDRTFAHVRYLPEVVRLDGKQSEFSKTTGQYLASAVSDTRVSTGRDKARAQDRTLLAIEAKYGVNRHIVAAIWGMETNYGGYRGTTHIPSALATLAYDGRRGAFFENQLIAALRILQQGDTTPDMMVGSWAGAMGHTQFMPTSYETYAVDFTGDGRRDIWAADPSDALASTAAYLNRMGWVRGMPWGVEVTLPARFDYNLVSGTRKMPSDWAQLGVRGADGRTVPNHGAARIILPAGAKGIAFMVFKNFDVIKRYNNSDAYALGVGHLGDRIGGAGPLRGSWPEGERALKRAERQELQSLLTRAGFSTGGVDGRIGPNTVKAIRGYQNRRGQIPDGHASVALLNDLRG